MQVACELHTVAPVQLLPPHCPYTDWVELPPLPAVVLVTVVRVVGCTVLVVVVGLVVVAALIVCADVVSPVVVATVVGTDVPEPVAGVPDAVMAEVVCVMETAPL